MERPIFKGAISLGSFLIPMRIIKATKDHDVKFHEYHATDMGRVGRSKPCKSCGTILAENMIIKGVEVSKDTVVTFTKEELDNLPVKSSKTVEIDRFVGSAELDELMFDNSYYVLPEDIGVKAYELFVNGLKKERKVAVGRISMRQRENTCIISVLGNGLLLRTLRYCDEVRDMPSVPKAQVVDDEVELICQVIKKYTKPFEPWVYTDQYTASLERLIQAKVKGETVNVASPEQPKEATSLKDALVGLLEKDNE